ncbi:unnamed protein product [Eruca vesicaria subsp. sativa]|uniref:Uncharacterized protein n=1 Tax=Eruca vesicaria subsp. sativa TaxID=29727 RepID=A0ABC8M7E0_ERUVS|nr:unnamed protein product [Eruca vesicaria subsp. sativa]
MENSSLSQCKHSSSTSYPLFGLVDFFLIGFFRWVSFAQIFFSRFCPLLQHQQCVSEKKSKDLEVQSLIKHDDGLCIEDAEMVMQSLGLYRPRKRGTSETLQFRGAFESV